MNAAAAGADLIVMCAAVADFRPIRVSGKITRHAETIPTLQLERTPDVLMNLIKHRRVGQTIVGFGALTGSEAQVREQGRKKALDKVPTCCASIESGTDTVSQPRGTPCSFSIRKVTNEVKPAARNLKSPRSCSN